MAANKDTNVKTASLVENNKTTFRSLNMELAITLVIAFIISVMVYLILSALINVFMEIHFASTDYNKKHDKTLNEKFRQFVQENSIKSDDWYMLRRWAESNDVYRLTIYQNHIMIFQYDSVNPDANYQKDNSINVSTEESPSDPVLIETDDIAARTEVLSFKDGKCDILLSGNYATKYYLISELISILIPMLLFNLILTFAVNRKLRYIKELSQQICVLSQGDFSTPIRLRGNDELTSMAIDLDRLRLSFVQKLKQNIRIQEERRDIITAMSHDMRTPMTPLIVYLQMLAEHKYTDDKQHEQYVNKSLEKAIQLKNLSDNMFSYLLLDKDTNIEMVTISMRETFYDQLSGMFDYLGATGFTIDADIALEDICIRVNMDYMYRIMDNLVSNIQKYADPEQYLIVKLYCEHNKVVLHIRNSINELADYSTSTGFGVKNIKKMMDNMSAEFIEVKKSGRYDTILLFEIVGKAPNKTETSENKE